MKENTHERKVPHINFHNLTGKSKQKNNLVSTLKTSLSAHEIGKEKKYLKKKQREKEKQILKRKEKI